MVLVLEINKENCYPSTCIAQYCLLEESKEGNEDGEMDSYMKRTGQAACEGLNLHHPKIRMLKS